MALLEWSERLKVGIAVVDADHERLVAMMNELFDAVSEGQGREALGDIIDGLVAYTVEHFAREEALFAESGYPDAAAHKREHEALRLQVMDARARFTEHPTTTLSLEVMNFLKNWLIRHIQGSDKKYAPHMTASGIR